MKPRSVIGELLSRLAVLRVALLFLFHAVVFGASYALACLLRFDFVLPPEFVGTFRSSLVVVVALQLTVGALFSFYRGWWRYVGVRDVVRLVFGLTTATAILMAFWFAGPHLNIDPRYVRPPRSVLLIDWAFSLLTIFGARVGIRIGRDHFRPRQHAPRGRRKVLIIGAGDAGEALAREIEHRPQLGMKVVGFVDDDRPKIGSRIRGIEVFGPIESIGDIACDTSADEALLAIPSASGRRIREIVRFLTEVGMEFKTMPGIDQLVNGHVQISQLRAVNIEDLLRRERIELPGDPVQELFRGRRVLVTGAGGTIGSELASQILQLQPERLTLIERSEYALYEVRKRLSRQDPDSGALVAAKLVDICDEELLERVVDDERPHIVLHAAAHKHVPLGEENPQEYVRNNCLATRSLAEICDRRGVERFVFISTDKAINPTSVMGSSKRAAEIVLLDLVRDSAMKLTVVRFGNVIGSSGSVVPLFLEQIAAGGPVTVTHPRVTRYFLRTPEAVSLVLQAATLGTSGSICMLDMGEPVKIADLARDLIRLSNYTEEEIPIVFTGLRPGEKLFEEIRLKGESIRPTGHPLIVMTEAPQPESAAVSRWLSKAAAVDAPDLVRAMLRELVPEYAMTNGAAAAEGDETEVPFVTPETRVALSS